MGSVFFRLAHRTPADLCTRFLLLSELLKDIRGLQYWYQGPVVWRSFCASIRALDFPSGLCALWDVAVTAQERNVHRSDMGSMLERSYRL